MAVPNFLLGSTEGRAQTVESFMIGGGGARAGGTSQNARVRAAGLRGADGRFRPADTGFSTGVGGDRGRCIVRRSLSLECDGVGGALGAAPRREAHAGGGEPRARRGRVGTGDGGGDLGAAGVARVVPHRLPALRQPLRAG